MKYSKEDIVNICNQFQKLVEEFELRTYTHQNISFGTFIGRVGTNKE